MKEKLQNGLAAVFFFACLPIILLIAGLNKVRLWIGSPFERRRMQKAGYPGQYWPGVEKSVSYRMFLISKRLGYRVSYCRGPHFAYMIADESLLLLADESETVDLFYEEENKQWFFEMTADGACTASSLFQELERLCEMERIDPAKVFICRSDRETPDGSDPESEALLADKRFVTEQELEATLSAIALRRVRPTPGAQSLL